MDKKKKTVIIIAAILILIICALGALMVWQKNSKEEEGAVRAMYVPYGEGGYIFVDTEKGTVFTVHMPEEIYDAGGRKIAQDGLQKGNIVKIYGNGIMLESYPGQYPGVTKIKVIEEGKPSDADKYQEIVDGIYQAPDPSQPPYLNVEYSTELANVSAVITRGGYTWSYTDEDGQEQHVVADSAHVLEWKEINDIRLQEPADLKLVFDVKPESVTAVRWPDSERKDEVNGAAVPEGETVEIQEKDGGYYITGVQAGYVYQITGTWDRGTAEFGFLTD